MKRCSKCKVEKPLDDFRRNRRMKDGRQHYCKVCQGQFDKNYESSARGREKVLAYNKRYYARNKEHMNAYCREYYRRHAEERKAASKRWIDNNRDRFRARAREYGKRPEVYAKFMARMHKNRTNATGENFNRFQWALVVALQNGCCAWCGAKARLAVDHIVPITNSDTSNAIWNIQGLCTSCNGAKGNKLLGTFMFTRPLLSRLAAA